MMMKLASARVATISAAIAAVIIVGVSGYLLGASRSTNSDGKQDESGRVVLYWYDPMVPGQKFDRPGRSPFMDMDLVPKYADEAAEDSGVRIDPATVQRLGMRLGVVERSSISSSVRGAGVIAFDGRNVAIIQSRASGFVERVRPLAVGAVVVRGAPIADIRVPEWTAAQAEYLALRGTANEEAARRRLVMLGMPASLIERVERDGRASPVTTIVSPIAGAVTSLDVRIGMTVAVGSPIATIEGMSPVWLVVSLPQSNAATARRGARVVARLAAYPGERFNGRIDSVVAAANAATRTVEVRISLPNSDGRLRPGMTAEVELSPAEDRSVLTVPIEAVIRTGQRTIVMAALGDGRFDPRLVELGVESGDRVEVRTGLNEGDRIVLSGQFLIDSEASMAGVVARRTAAEGAAPVDPAAHEANGRIQAIDGVNVRLAHGPVPSLSWPSMTMDFQLARPELGRGLSVGDQVTFRFREGGAGYVIESIERNGARP